MSNPLKGAVDFKIDGESHSLSFSAEALFRLEKQLGMKLKQIEEQMRDENTFGFEMVRTMFWAGLLDSHEGISIDDVGKYLKRIPPLEALLLVTKAFQGAFVDPDAPVVEKPVDPQ